MTLKVKSEEYHDGVGLTWDDTGLPLSKREGQAWWAGWDEGRKDGEIDTREELADEIERLRATLNQTRRFALSGEMDTLVSDEIERLREALWEIAKTDVQTLAKAAIERRDWALVERIAEVDQQGIAHRALLGVKARAALEQAQPVAAREKE